jgi:hypothetical protein
MLLTANCVHQIVDSIPENYYFLVGKFDSGNDERTSAKIPVSSIVIHPNYDPDSPENNLAIAFLKSSTSLSPICLPGARKSVNDIFSKRIYVIGWEPKFENGRSSPNGFAKVSPTVPISTPECSDAFSNDLKVSNGQYFCTKAKGGKGPCDGKFCNFKSFWK